MTEQPSEIDAFVTEQTAEIRRLASRSGQDIIEIGKRLIAVKDHLPHGAFGPWIDAEFGWTDRTARRFMEVAGAFGQIGHGVRFEAKALYALASGDVPQDVRDRFIAQAEAGEPVRHRDVREAIQPTSPGPAPREPVGPTPVLALVDMATGEVVQPDGSNDDKPDDITDPPAGANARRWQGDDGYREAYRVAAGMTPEQRVVFDADTARYDERPRLGEELSKVAVFVGRADVAFAEIDDRVVHKYLHDNVIREQLEQMANGAEAVAARCRELLGAGGVGLRRVR